MPGEPAARSTRPRLLASLPVRIVGAFVGAIVLMLGALAYLVFTYQGLSRSQHLVVDGFIPLSQDISRLGSDLERVDRDLERLSRDAIRPLSGSVSPFAIYLDEIAENLKIAGIRANSARHLAQSPQDLATLYKVTTQLDRISTSFAQYQRSVADYVARVEAGDRLMADPIRAELRKQAAMLDTEIESVEASVKVRISQLTQETEQARLSATAGAAGLTSIALLVSLALLLAVLYALRPVAQLTAEVQRLAAGGVGGQVEVRGADEIALLAVEFNRMVRAIELRDRRLVERADELNRVSRYLSGVLDALSDALVAVDDGLVTLANPAAVRQWGATVGEPMPEALSSVFAELGTRETVVAEQRVHAVRVASFGETGRVLVTSDITEQEQAKEALARSERLALIGQMLAQITHEVRNPLNALSLNTELLTDELDALDPKRKTEAWELLETISGEIERLTQVTAHYLQLARRPPAELVPEDLHSLVRDLVRLLDVELDQVGVQLEVTLDPCPLQRVDGRQLRQALLNVVRNAVEAGGLHLSLHLARTEDELRFDVHDDGEGMSEAALAKATDPFFSTKAKGTGLGLAITRQILEDHGGTVRVVSSVEGGTTITLALPDRPVQAGAAPHEEGW